MTFDAFGRMTVLAVMIAGFGGILAGTFHAGGQVVQDMRNLAAEQKPRGPSCRLLDRHGGMSSACLPSRNRPSPSRIGRPMV